MHICIYLHCTRWRAQVVSGEIVCIARTDITPPRPSSTVVRDLGVFVDAELTFREHVWHVTSTCFFHLRRLRQSYRRTCVDFSHLTLSSQHCWITLAASPPKDQAVSADEFCYCLKLSQLHQWHCSDNCCISLTRTTFLYWYSHIGPHNPWRTGFDGWFVCSKLAVCIHSQHFTH